LAALRALQVLFAEDIYSRNDYFEYLKYLLEIYHEDPSFLAFTICDCEMAGTRALLAVIETLYKDQLVDELVIDLPFVRERLLTVSEEASKLALKQSENSSFVCDTLKALRWWGCFDSKKQGANITSARSKLAETSLVHAAVIKNIKNAAAFSNCRSSEKCASMRKRHTRSEKL
jgi:hypothetical protein